jgi:predicted glycoside hydrolase/deacetylase ChbG (UPF0249 family)
MKSIILCADDYGQTTAISQAIIQLIQKNRLTATSCLTTSPHWKEHGMWLKEFDFNGDIGLHFNLTEGEPLSQMMKTIVQGKFLSLSKLVIQAYLRKLDFNAILAELNAQIDEFVAIMGRMPDYIDGHQHVHQLPIIRDAVFKVFEDRFRIYPGSYIRCVSDPKTFLCLKNDAYIKRSLIQLLGASAFKMQLLKRKIPHNASFSGIYNFKNSKNYKETFNAFLDQITDNGLIMCHPGLETEEPNKDEIYSSRPDEYQYLISADFLEACHKQQVKLKRFYTS